MTQENQPMTLAAVNELPDDTWINGGFTAVAASIEQKKCGATSRTPGKPFWVVNLASQTGPERAEWALFTFPKFGEGDLIEVTGQGIKRKTDTHSGGVKIQAGDKAIVSVLGKSAHHEDQQQRKAAHEPAVNGKPQPVHGQTVGMAMKEALALRTRFAKDSGELSGWFTQPEFWAAVHETASDIIRVSHLLEAGKLAPAVKDRTLEAIKAKAEDAKRTATAQTSGRADPPKSTTRPQPGPAGSVGFDEDNGEDVPF